MTETDFPWQQRRAALIIAHPGHELRVHRWMEMARPLVLVLTDGSGRSSESRLASTTRILNATGARVGVVCGRFSDAGIYDAMLHSRERVFADLLREMAGLLEAEGVEYVVHDALEGYNPSHDLCWHLAGAAALLAEKSGAAQIRRFDFLLTGRPDECPPGMKEGAIRVRLDDAALARKIAAAAAYPELKSEVDAAVASFGKAPFATEYLWPAADAATHLFEEGDIPFYEKHGEARRVGGHYAEVIRRKGHVLPLARMLWKTAAEG